MTLQQPGAKDDMLHGDIKQSVWVHAQAYSKELAVAIPPKALGDPANMTCAA